MGNQILTVYYCGGNSRGQFMRMMCCNCSPARKKIFLMLMNKRIGRLSCVSVHSQVVI